jgi:glycosyltransferase involved in cell wall biosynthesis
MKIIFITREGARLPGARIRCYRFAEELRKYGIETAILSFADHLAALDGEFEAQMGLKKKIKLNFLAWKELAQEKNAAFCLQRFHYHAFAPYLCSIFKKNRLILDLDDWEMREDPKYYFGFYPSSKAHYFIRQAAKRSVFCIAGSHYLEEFLSAFNKNTLLIPSGVDTEIFKPSGRVTSYDKIVFSWIGTFHRPEYVENIDLAVGCFLRLRKRFDHIYLDIVGAGIHEQSIKALVNRQNDGHIRLKEWIPHEQMPAYLDTIDIGLMPIAKDTKFNKAKSPTKVFEYMAMAKPVVASAVGECAIIFDDAQNGLLAKSEDEFTHKMRRLIEDRQLRQQLGINAKKSVEASASMRICGERFTNAIKKYL